MIEDRKDPAETVIPLVEERVTIEKQKRATGTVRVRKVVHEEERVIDEPLLHEEFEVNRVPVERWVEAPVPERTEGATLVVSLHREVLVVERRLQVFEELHITPRRREERRPQTVVVRHEEAIVERTEAPPDE